MRKCPCELGQQVAGLQVQVRVVADVATVLGWFDVSSALHAMCGELDGWNVLITYEQLETEEALRGQLRLGGEAMGRRHDEPTGDLPF